MKEPLDERIVSRTAPQEILTVHGGGLAPVSRLALIEDDRVWCLDLETYEPVRCRFTAESGSWVRTPTGRYALAGQAIDQDGQPGGRFVVAASVGTDGTVPGVDVSTLRDAGNLDNAVGFSSQVPLGFGQGVLETLNAATNVTGLPLRNYATRTVCAASDPHPDGAPMVGSPSPGVFCYRGAGAALNDINGWERDEFGNYLPDERCVHRLRVAAFEIPAAKRPATGGYPPTVHQRSQILWRPVDPRVRIAN